MKRMRASLLVGGAGLLLLVAAAAPAAAAPIPVDHCQTLAGNGSYQLVADLQQIGSAACLLIAGNGTTIDLNGHSISGLDADNSDGAGIDASDIDVNFGYASNANNVTVLGPGIIHDFGFCLRLGNHALVQNVLVHDCQPDFVESNSTKIGLGGITLGSWSKCVECRVHDVSISNPPGGAWGIWMGDGCLLEASIVDRSDNGVNVGGNCKVWDLVLDSISHVGLWVHGGTEVARSVISHCANGPGIIYDCGSTTPAGVACQDSSNSVSNCPGGGTFGQNIADGTAPVTFPPGPPFPGTWGGQVVTDCATNVQGTKYQGTTVAQCLP